MMEDERHGPPIPWLEDASYTASYCEENVYLLLARYMAMPHEAIYVVFVSNPNKSVVLFESRTAPAHLESKRFPVVWDYHVILLISNGSGEFHQNQTWVYDFDSRLQKPCELQEYLNRTFHPGGIQYPDRWKSQFRLICGRDFLDYFASDRSHMIRQRTQGENLEGEGEIQWLAPPPSYPVIQGGLAGTPRNLFSRYVDMEFADETSLIPDSQSLPKYGHVMSEVQLRSFFKVNPAPEGTSS